MDESTRQPDDHSGGGHSEGGQTSRDDDGSSYGPPPSGYERLYRPVHGRMIAGVAAGIAGYLGIDATIMRIALVLLTVIGGAGIPVYAAGWLLMPDEESEASIASELIDTLQSRPS